MEHPTGQDMTLTRQQTIEILQSIRRGALLDEIGAALVAAVQAQQEIGRKASLTVSIAIERPKDVTDQQMVLVTGAVTKKLPPREPNRQILYVDRDRVLTVHDPRQPDMFTPRAVDSPPGSATADQPGESGTG